MENRGKVIPLADQLYVSPYLLRPLRRLEEVEGRAGENRAAGKDRTAKRGETRGGSKQPQLRSVEKS